MVIQSKQIKLSRQLQREIDAYELKISEEVSIYHKDDYEFLELVRKKIAVEKALEKYPGNRFLMEKDAALEKDIEKLDSRLQTLLNNIKKAERLTTRLASELQQIRLKLGMAQWTSPAGIT